MPLAVLAVTLVSDVTAYNSSSKPNLKPTLVNWISAGVRGENIKLGVKGGPNTGTSIVSDEFSLSDAVSPLSVDTTGVQEPDMICTDISFGSAVLSIAAFGGKAYCCDICANDDTKACCPTMDKNGYVRAAPRPLILISPCPHLRVWPGAGHFGSPAKQVHRYEPLPP